MTPTTVVAALLLMTVFCLGLMVLRADARGRRIEKQVQLATFNPSREHGGVGEVRSVRIRAALIRERRPLLARITGYDPQGPRTIPAAVIVLVATGAALTEVIPARLFLPLWAVPVPALVTAVFVCRSLFRWQARRYADKLMRQLPDTIELVVSAVRTGLPIVEAFRAVAREMPDPTREQFNRVLDEIALGRAPNEALLAVQQRTQLAEYAIFAVTLAVQSRAGGGLADTLGVLGDSIRERAALAAKAKALAGEATLSARVLASLPFLAGAAMMFSNPHSLDMLLEEPRGQKLAMGGVISLLLGIGTMRRMIRKGTTV